MNPTLPSNAQGTTSQAMRVMSVSEVQRALTSAKAKTQTLKKQLASAKRREDNQRKIILGAMALNAMRHDPNWAVKDVLPRLKRHTPKNKSLEDLGLGVDEIQGWIAELKSTRPQTENVPSDTAMFSFDAGSKDA